ncbi:3-hydroxybutyryl-CoA dehydrogenase [Brevundimonas bullata]|uniref:3-hydroxybutyryl-CoA dehydrogenase n=1 Tax=Brevundimonas bullata TaxID=13160 RepID=A0A7W7N5X2_9CAUL|nr:3-hydroxyacyl-CoA dehydrogenase [Brevundimonas bullata]MBB4799816.1 3-hydroxybutyryl-CoA dehydrogenase [Brevundimonas bullata]MBB6384774.1 3-hydroxybutyryl-CoA dehydrogenase [Brevundimonas bullata]
MAKVAVVGAGLMGVGIAHAFASAGHDVRLVDVSSEQLAKAEKTVAGILADGVRLGKADEASATAALARFSTSESLTDSAMGADLLVETVSENLTIKTEVVRKAEAVMAPTGLIATNTSALSVTEIAAACQDPSRVIGMHFFNPVQKMKLVELVRGLATTDAAVARCRDYVAQLGKTAIVVNETPGLTTSRMSAMAGNEAMWMLQEGAATAEDIDTALRLGFNHPMGPLELGDLTGWDTRLSVLHYLHSTLGDKFRPCPLIIKMVKAGRYGRKVGWGVYRYENGLRVPGSGLRGSQL